MLNISPRQLEKVIYFVSYIVLDPGETNLTKMQLLTENEYREMREQYGDTFRVGIGAEAIKELLTDLDLDALYTELREEIRTTSGQRNIKAVRRMEVVEAFQKIEE